MKAMILASGTGSRLMPLTKEIPKCLVEIHGKSILEMQLEHLEKAGITDIIITTGPFKEKIETLCKSRFHSLTITYRYNEHYDSTNYIFSMYNCREDIDDDFFLLHGDLVFNNALIKGMLQQTESCVLINREVPRPEKDFKGLISEGRVIKIGVSVFDINAFFLAPLYKLSKKSFNTWMDKIIEFVESGHVTCYAEDAFNLVSRSIALYPYYFSDLFCMELDTLEDLDLIKRSNGQY